MGSTTIAPPAAAPAPAASSPASAPSTSVTPSPAVSTPPATPAPAAEAPKSSGNAVLDKLTAGWQKVTESTPAAEPTEEPAIEPAADSEPEPVAEPALEPEAVAEEEKPAEAVAEPTEEVPELLLEDAEVLGPKGFIDEIATDPATKAFFDTHPELKNRVCAALRRDGENREIRQYIPDVATAKTVTAAAATFQTIDNKFMSGANPDGSPNPEGIQGFLNSWVQEAMILDDKGAPVMENGKYKLHPALTNTFDHIFNNKLSVLAERAKTSGDERLQTALDVIKGVLAPSPSAADEVPDELKPYADSIKARETAVKAEEEKASRQRQESQQVAQKQSIDRAESKAADSIKGQLKPLFTKAGLTEFEQTAALREIGERVDEKLSAHGLYQSQYDSILLQPPSEAREKALAKHMLLYANEFLGPVAAQVIRAAKGGALERQTTRDTKVATQRTASAADPRGTSITPSSPAPQTPALMREQVVKEYQDTHGGERPDAAYIVSETWKRTQAAQQKKAS